MFIAEVHNRVDLEGVSKLTYLKTTCVGVTAEALGSWGHTNENYEGAWVLLNSRYEDAYSIQQSLLDRLLMIPITKSESHEGLNHVSSSVSSVLRQLASAGLVTDIQ